jgi:hypothetical protein
MRSTTARTQIGWRLKMSIRTKIVALTAVALAITGSVASTTTPAEARGFNHHGFNHYDFDHHDFNHYDFNRHDFNYYNFRHYGNDGYDHGGDYYCRWAPRFDVYGNYIGRVRNCGY